MKVRVYQDIIGIASLSLGYIRFVPVLSSEKNSTFRDDYLVKARGGTHARKNRIAKKRHNFSFIFHISVCNLSVIDTAIEQHEQRRTTFDVRVIGQ